MIDRLFDTFFVVPGCPIPYHRAQYDPRSGRRYTHRKSEQYRAVIAAEAFAATRWDFSSNGAMRRAQTWPNAEECSKVQAKRKLRPRGARLPDCSCPWCSTEYRLDVFIVLPDRRTRDLDNIEKNILDACSGVLWYDDRQAFVRHKDKAYNACRPRVEVKVNAYDAQLIMNWEEDDSWTRAFL